MKTKAKSTKFKTYGLLATALLLGLSSCSNDDVAGVDSPKPNGRGELTTVDIFAKPASSGLTYALSATDAAPTANEAKINTAFTYIFDAAGALEEVVSLTPGTSGASASGVTITSGAKTFYIVANPSTHLATLLPTSGSTMAESTFTKLLVANGAQTDMTSVTGLTNGFLMTIPEGGKAQNLTAGGSNNVTTPIGRAMAKTNVNFPSTVTYNGLGGTLQNVEYLVRNVKNNSFNQAIYNGNQLESYDFTKWTAGPTPALTATDFFIEGGTITGTAGFPTSIQTFLGAASLTDGTAANYAFENANSVPLYGTSTSVQIGGNWVLDNSTPVHDASNALDASGLNAAGDFWRIVEFDDDPATGTPTEVVREISSKYYNAQPNAATVAAEITALSNPAVVTANVGFLKYDKGQMFYSVYLTNPTTPAPTAASELYMVERNKYYYVTVKSINQLGSNTAEILKPGDPIKTTVDINAVISVADWADASSSVDL